MIRAVLEHFGAEIPKYGQKLRCPFHDDHTASALYSDDTQWFTCLACGVMGNPVKLLMDREGLQYDEAKRLASQIAGEEYREVPREFVRGMALPRRQGNNRKDGRAF